MYIVHTTIDRKRASYTMFRDAFRAFKRAKDVRDSSAAIWEGSYLTDRWVRLYATANYPERLSRPYCDARPHSFQQV